MNKVYIYVFLPIVLFMQSRSVLAHLESSHSFMEVGGTHLLIEHGLLSSVILAAAFVVVFLGRRKRFARQRKRTELNK